MLSAVMAGKVLVLPARLGSSIIKLLIRKKIGGKSIEKVNPKPITYKPINSLLYVGEMYN